MDVFIPASFVGKAILSPCCCSVAQPCLTLCDPMDCSTPSFPVLHHLPELAQNRVHRVGDAIQPSHPLSPPSPPAFYLSGSFPVNQLFPSGGQSIGASASVAVLPMSIQGWFFLGLTGWISLQSRGLSGVVCNTTVRKHQFFNIHPSLPWKVWKEHFLGSYHKRFWFSRTRLESKNHLWSFTVIRLARRVP